MDDIKFVINLDYPNNSEDYVHRIGRTGRSNNTGTAYTFFTPNNANKAGDLISVLQEAKQVVNPKLVQMAESSRHFVGTGIVFCLAIAAGMASLSAVCPCAGSHVVYLVKLSEDGV